MEKVSGLSVSLLADSQHSSSQLSPREFEALALIAEGLSNRGIGARLFVSDKTVEALSRSIFLKLGLAGDDQFENRRVKAAVLFHREMG